MYGRYVAEERQMPSDSSRVHILDGDSKTFRCGLPRWTLSEGYVPMDSVHENPRRVWWTNEASEAYHLATCPGCRGVEEDPPEPDIEVEVEDMSFSWEKDEG